MSDPTGLAHLVDAAVAEVEGVARLYSAAPALAGIARAVVGVEGAASASVSAGDPPTVTVSVGVDGATPSREVAERVAAVVHTVAGADAAVHVRVSRVHL